MHYYHSSRGIRRCKFGEEGLCGRVFKHLRPFKPSKHDSSCWTRQVHTRDETGAFRNSISLTKFGTRISNSVAEFLDVSFISSSMAIIDRAFSSAMHGEWSRGRPLLGSAMRQARYIVCDQRHCETTLRLHTQTRVLTLGL